jgi:hypothetical protein
LKEDVEFTNVTQLRKVTVKYPHCLIVTARIATESVEFISVVLQMNFGWQIVSICRLGIYKGESASASSTHWIFALVCSRAHLKILVRKKLPAFAREGKALVT